MPDQIFTEPGSFRDHSGYVFYRNNKVYRRINLSYQREYDHLISSGLYNVLIRESLLIPHEEVDVQQFPSITDSYKIIRPQPIPFISYPYEWCFEQLKEAALLTLRIQKIALDHGMILKDASAYNIQFQGTQPLFIDTLSFAIYEEGNPWAAYRQFCQHFLAVLALMKYKDSRMSFLLQSSIDGIPLDLASRLLPLRTKWNFSILTHIHLQAKSIKKYETLGNKTTRQVKISKTSLLALIDHLGSSVKALTYGHVKSQWSNYYDITNYTEDGILHKEEIVKEFIQDIPANLAWDIGANNGRFSRILSEKGIYTVSADLDHEAVQRNFLFSRTQGTLNLLPLVLDITNPSPALGWRNNERKQWNNRQKPDIMIALALIHHLCFSHNIGFDSISSYFSGLCKRLIIEFVPAEDSQVAFLPKPNAEIANDYSHNNFEQEFLKYFDLEKRATVKGSKREIYLLRSK